MANPFFPEGYQLLHAVYAVERFLHSLVQRKCNFHLAFFDSHERLCIPPGTPDAKAHLYLFARSVTIRHLKAHLPCSHPSISLQIFDSVYDVQFDAYLDTSGAYFFLCHDGASSVIEHRLQKKHSFSTKVLYRSLIYSLMKRGYNVALINGLEWMDTKVRSQKCSVSIH